LQYLRKAVELAGDNAKIREHLGDVLAELGRGDEAAEQYRKALEIDPEAQGVREKLESLGR
jgi:Flp pilus assembly protein TadD